jgi:hypothetical protein
MKAVIKEALELGRVIDVKILKEYEALFPELPPAQEAATGIRTVICVYVQDLVETNWKKFPSMTVKEKDRLIEWLSRGQVPPAEGLPGYFSHRLELKEEKTSKSVVA